jgi:hypothetical protein
MPAEKDLNVVSAGRFQCRGDDALLTKSAAAVFSGGIQCERSAPNLRAHTAPR